jgi:hypothetical protein
MASGATTTMNDTTLNRLRIAHRIHDLLLQELGEDMDVALMLGPPEYARAVLSLCRSCGSAELSRLVEQFQQASDEEARARRREQLGAPAHLASLSAVPSSQRSDLRR